MSLPTAVVPQAPAPVPAPAPAPPAPALPAPAPGPATAAAGEHKADLAAISVQSRIPEFWTDQPRLWYIQVDAILEPQHLNEVTKCNLVIAKLPKQVIQQVTDIISDPPSPGRYKQLKERLITIYEETETRQIQKLLNEMDLGEQRPSQLLRRMRDLARGKLPDDTLKILWQGHLPIAVRGVLAVTDETDLEVLCRIADKVLENTAPASGIAELAEPGPSATPAFAKDIIAEIRKLGQRFGNPRQVTTGRGRGQSRGGAASSASGKKSRNPNWLCYYHFRYKEKAHQCVPPCNWKPEN